jgi:FixJ family two-component response regulator
MPRLTGLQLIDEVNRCNGKIPIIVISAYQDKELVTALKGRGCADFLDKIPDEEELVRRIDLVLRKGV